MSRKFQEIGLDKIVQSLPDKYDTAISDEKNTLNSSEKEMICIARALIRDSKILLLDNFNIDISKLFENRPHSLLGITKI